MMQITKQAKLINTQRELFEQLCQLSEIGVLSIVSAALSPKYKKIIQTPSYVIGVGDIPVALVAHADTVFTQGSIKRYFMYDKDKKIIMNPFGLGADDRAGILGILYILQHTKFRPSIVITTGEEEGCVGAEQLIQDIPKFPTALNFMIELDRQGYNDAVYYQCANTDFENYISSFGFATALGSFSDISVLAPAWNCAAVNLSIGYFDEHTYHERFELESWLATMTAVCEILKDQILYPKHFKYCPKKIAKIHRYLPTSQNRHYDVCDNCKFYIDDTEAIPIINKDGQHVLLCMDCFSKQLNEISWCKRCGQGYHIGQNLHDWTCEDCKSELQKNTKPL